jgi:hypothetical protein
MKVILIRVIIGKVINIALKSEIAKLINYFGTIFFANDSVILGQM